MQTKLQAVNNVLHNHIKATDRHSLNDTVQALTDVIGTTAGTLPGIDNKEIATFYAYVGYTAVLKDITILDPSQLKRSIGFKEIPEMLTVLFEQLGQDVFPAHIKDSAATYNTIYSKQPITVYTNDNSWQKHVVADLNSVHKLLVKPKTSNWLNNLETYFATEGVRAKFRYQDQVESIIEFLGSMYETNYQLTRPAGIIIPFSEEATQASIESIVTIEKDHKTRQGAYKVEKAQGDLYRAIAHQAFSHLDGADLNIMTDATDFNIAEILKTPEGVRSYYPLVHARLLYKYSLFSKEEVNLGVTKYVTWEDAKEGLRKYIDLQFKKLIAYAFNKHAKTEANFYNIDGTEDLAEAVKANTLQAIQLEKLIKQYYIKLYQTFLTVYILTEFKGSNDSPAKFIVRFSGYFNKDYNAEAYIKATTTESYKVLSQDENTKIEPTRNLLNKSFHGLTTKQIEHTFNKEVATSIPVFAASALNYLKNLKTDGPPISWERLLVGMDMDGNIIVGQDKVQYINHIVHFLQAGSRAGKGVMSYNLILSANSDKRLSFFNDRKPDTTKALALHAGTRTRPDGVEVPNLAVINGGQKTSMTEADKKFYQWQGILTEKNKYSWFNMNGAVLDDFVYMRQMLITVAVTKAIVDGENKLKTMLEKLDLPTDFVTGVFALFDEYTNFVNAFAKYIHPTAKGSVFEGAATSKAMLYLAQGEGAAYLNLKDKKGYYDELTMDKVYKGLIIDQLTKYNAGMSNIGRAGLIDIKGSIDFLFIGQGLYGQFRTGVEIQEVKSGDSFRVEKLAEAQSPDALQDYITACFSGMGPQDYIQGAPNGFPASDLLGAEGKTHWSAKNTKAMKYLNLKNRGFAYFTGSQKATRADNAFYFKPFLLLNDGLELPALRDPSKRGADFKNASIENMPGSYLANLATNLDLTPGITWSDIREQIKDDLGLDDPAYAAESLAGVRPYAEAIGFKQENYELTLKFMDKLLQYIGYPGDYYDFVTDTRPEWFIGIDDFSEALYPPKDYQGFSSRKSLKMLRTYVNSPFYKDEEIQTHLIGLNTDNDLNEEDEENIENIEASLGDYYEEQEYEEEPDELNTDLEFTNLLTQTADVLGFVDADLFEEEDEEDDDPLLQDEDDIYEEADEPHFNTQEETETPRPFVSPVLEVIEPEQLAEQKVRKALTTVQKLAQRDVLKDQLAYSNIQLYELSSKHPDVDLVSWYEEAYKEAYRNNPKTETLELKLHSGIEHAKETRELLGVQALDIQDAIAGFTAQQGVKPQGFALIKQQTGIFKQNLAAYMRADREEEVLQRTGDTYTPQGLKRYGTKDIYMFEGQAKKVNSLDYVLTSEYQPVTGVQGTSVDIDKTLIDYMQRISTEIINKVSGLNNIRTIDVQAGGKMIINEQHLLSFAIPKEEYAKLPLLIRSTVDQGLWGQLFIWGYVKQCPNLRKLTISSDDFVQDYLRPAWITKGNTYPYLSPTHILTDVPSIQTLVIATETHTREQYNEQKQSEDTGFFARHRRKAKLKEQTIAQQEQTEQYYNQAFNTQPQHKTQHTNEYQDQSSRTSRRAKALGKRTVKSAHETTGNLTHAGYNNSKSLVRYGFQRRGLGKLLGVAGLGLTAIAGTGLVLYKAVDWAKDTVIEVKDTQ